MDYSWMDEYCLAKPGVIKDYKVEWEVNRYMIGGKMFAMHGEHSSKRPIITLKLDPIDGDFLRQQYAGDIIPGYYMNKVHWNSVFLDREIPAVLLRDMLDKSYQILLASLPKKVQSEILAR